MRQTLALIPGHERQLQEIDKRVSKIERTILEIEHKLLAIDDVPAVIRRCIADAMEEPKDDIKDIKREQQRNSDVISKVMKVTVGFAVIGFIAAIFAIAQLSVDDLVNLITGRIPKP